ncbi:spore coat polysaccharide flippase ExoM [Myxococcus sp. K38C18041901]|uniref:spore coat polysaccharide flippase ExoM n=1 Tax=Myxococcus guangdongensis TaxID=2906760 RepID=UPI0020A70758|nr:spore coat polysaccharide flippase ExoM [Myxococcus guangdongensis]MCP3059960.1 spore coat polysaccharide flippase ExoM [Myxococcus guangdongensis]
MSGAASPAAAGGSFLGRAGPLVLARLFTAGLTLSIPLVLARVLHLDEYGTYYQLFLIATTLYYVLPFGVVQSLYYFLPRTGEKRPYLGQTLLFMSGAGLVGGLLVQLLMGPVAGWFSNPQLLEYRWELAAYTAFLLGSFPLEVSLTAQGRTKASAVVYLVSDAVRASVMVLPPLLGFSLHGLMVAVCGFTALRFVATWVVCLRGVSGPLVSGPLLRAQLAYAAPFGAAMFLAIPQQNAHLYMVAGAVAPAMYALYRVGCFQLPVVDLLYTPTSEVLMVRLGELEREGRLEEGVDAFREAAGKLAYVFLPFAAFLFAAAPEFIGALFGEKFLPAVPVFRISVLGVVLSILPMDGTLRARGLTRAIFVSYAVKAAVTVPLVYFGVKHLGMMGGIGSWAVAEVVGKVLLLTRIPAALSTPRRSLRLVDVIPWRELGRASLAAGAAGLGVFVLRAAAQGAWGHLPEGFFWRVLPLALAGVLFSVGYVVMLYVAGVRPLAVLAGLRPRRTA